MATLERIRRRSGLLIVLIGVAMLAFILTDLLGSGNSILRADANVIGEVDGKKIEIPEFQKRMDDLRTRIAQQNPQQAQMLTTKQLADGVWDEIVREEVMAEQYDELGIRVSSDELYERLKSNPNIQSAPAFQDQGTGRFSEALFQQYLNNIESNRVSDEQAATAYTQWLDFEQSVKTNTLQTKYNTAVEKGLFVPTAIAREMQQRNEKRLNTRFVAMEYATVSDSTVELSDGDFKEYYNENKEQFKAEKAASIEYVSFQVIASEQDRQDIQNELKGLIGDSIPVVTDKGDTLETFMTTKDDSAFAATMADVRRAPDYYTRDKLPQGLDSTIMDKPVGYVAGPYETAGTYRITKITDKRTLPDSVKARHILLSFQGLERGNPERTAQEAKALADSLVERFKNDTTGFAQAARELSDDPGSGAKGGDLGWFGPQQMVRPFSNFSFRNDVGDIGLVPSQFGFHIIEVTDQKGASPAVKLVTIDRQIQPSETTLDDIYNNASQFAANINSADEFATKAEEAGYTPRVATNLKAFDENIPGIGANREVVKWANGVGVNNEDSEVGDIQLFTSGDPYIVAVLTDRNEKGYRELSAIKEQIRPQVMKEKKAEMFITKFNEAMNGNSDINALGQALGLQVRDQEMSFQSPNINGFGNEPKVVGAVSALESGQMSNPIKGSRGVYVVMVNGVTAAPEMPDYAPVKMNEQQQVRDRVQSALFNSLKEGTDLDDRRPKFY